MDYVILNPLSKFVSSHFFILYGEAIISGPGIICGPIWGSFPVLGSFAVHFGDHLRSRDHLRACTVLMEIEKYPLYIHIDVGYLNYGISFTGSGK